MKYIMTTSMGRNGIKIATARVFTEPREAWDYALQLRVTPHCENCCFYLVGDETKPKKMKTRPSWCTPPEEPRDKYPEFCEELHREQQRKP
tara:strand:+ start:703 stop:975 length:273 start_codon:yes stop_codon:yes gene_type:complete